MEAGERGDCLMTMFWDPRDLGISVILMGCKTLYIIPPDPSQGGGATTKQRLGKKGTKDGGGGSCCIDLDLYTLLADPAQKKSTRHGRPRFLPLIFHPEDILNVRLPT